MKKRHCFAFAALFIACLSVHLSADDLNVQPLENFESSGLPGGPFTPVLKQYYLRNDGNSILSWGVNSTVNWLLIGPKWGMLAPGASATVNIRLTDTANSFGEGIYTATLIFLNMGSQQEQYRDVILTVDFPDGFWVTPQNLDVNIIEGTDLSRKITIGNGSPADLNYIAWTKKVPALSAALGGEKQILDSVKKSSFLNIEGSDFTIADNVLYKEGELLVRFKNHRDLKHRENAKEKILKSLGGASVKRNFKVVPDSSVIVLPSNVTVKQALKLLSKSEEILSVQPNYQVHMLSSFPNDTRFGELWGLHNTGQNGGAADADIDAPETWDIFTSASDVTVAVIDSGVDYTHPDLAGNMWKNPGEIPGNSRDDDRNGYVDDVYGYDFRNRDGDPRDDLYHGTHVAGIIGAEGNNNLGVTGVCWNVKIMALKFIGADGTGWTDDAIEAIEYSILMGARLSNNSWGGDAYNPFLEYAIEETRAAGMLFVAGAGNGSSDNDMYPFYPANYESDCLISVMATDKLDLMWNLSNYGEQSVDLAAPGSSILSCMPSNKYQFLSGTSMSTAYVSGVCALLWSIDPSLSSSRVKEIILHSVDKVDSLKNKCVSNGRLNMYQAISETQVPYIRLEPQAGSLEPNTIEDINIIFDTNGLLPDTYNSQLLIIPDDPCCQRLIVPVRVTIQPDVLVVAPSEDLIVQGRQGGPFQPNCKKYTLVNDSDETVDWTASWNEQWLSVIPQSGSLEPNETIDVDVCFKPEVRIFEPNIYSDQIIFKNLNTGSLKKRNISLTIRPPDSFVEFFEESAGQLTGLMITFTPDGSRAYYEACRDSIDVYPVDPNGGIYVSLWDDDYSEVVLDDGVFVQFYGSLFDRFYIGSNGYITFGQGDVTREPTLETHFALPRISALFTDLNPSSEFSISYKKLDDRIAVTFKDVPVFGEKDIKNSFQIEMFFASGQIRISWLNIAAAQAMAGLSEGNGSPGFLFEESALQEYPVCWIACDFNRDYFIDFTDVAAFAVNWFDNNCSMPGWCNKADFNLDGTVDEGDLVFLMENWLMSNLILPAPFSHWKFDEGQGTDASDSAGSNNGIIMGAASWVMGKIGDYALDFDGSDDYVFAGNLDAIGGPNPFSMCAWIYPRATEGINRDILSEAWDLSGYGVQFLSRLNSSGHFCCMFSDGSVFNNSIISNAAVLPSNWTFVAFSWDGTMKPDGMKVYLNGILDNAVQSKCPIAISIDMPAFIGAYSNGGLPMNFFDGVIDDVRVYNQLLTAEQIRQLYREGLK